MKIEIPITSCHECGQPFTLAIWRKLELLASEERDEPPRTIERRTCACGAAACARVDGLEDLDLCMDAVRYASLFGYAPPRPPLRIALVAVVSLAAAGAAVLMLAGGLL